MTDNEKCKGSLKNLTCTLPEGHHAYHVDETGLPFGPWNPGGECEHTPRCRETGE